MNGLFKVLLFLVFSGIGSISILNISSINVSLTNVLFILLLGVFILNVIKANSIFLPTKNISFLLTILLSSSLILLPLLGILFYAYEISHISDILNWLLNIMLLIIILNIYKNGSEEIFEDLTCVLKWAILVQLTFFTVQVLNALNIIQWTSLLDWRFEDSKLKFGHIGRFNGAMSTLSGLGFISSLTFMFFSYRIYFLNKKEIIFAFVSLLLLLASGHRTSLIVVIIFFLFFFFYYALKKGEIKKIIKYFVSSILLGSVIYYIAWSFNIGRLQTSNRYKDIVSIFTGEVNFNETSGRFTRWTDAYIYMMEKSNVLGLLANPSHVYPGLPIDSWYVTLFIQGGVFLLSLFVINVIVIILSINKKTNTNLKFLAIIILNLIVVGSINQNFLTDDLGRYLFTLVAGIAILSNSSAKKIKEETISVQNK